MRPIPIPAGFLELHRDRYGASAHPLVLASPDGDIFGDVRPVETIRWATEVEIAGNPRGLVAYSTICALEDGDLATLTAGGWVELTFIGGNYPIFQIAAVPVPPLTL